VKQAAFWLAVAGTALVADPVFSLVADSQVVQRYAPGLKTLNDYRTKKNG
jgi:L-ascorbate metabolism protein UlaG (beta-lactamase superfamily)